MTKENKLERFLSAQDRSYETALSEIKKGRKESHWMWYIFPQIQGLGSTEISRFYAIKNSKEAKQFLLHPVLGVRLIALCNELLQLNENSATRIFGTPDDLKLKSSMTLFDSLNLDPVFSLVLEKFFNGAKDNKTLQLLSEN